MRGFLYAATLLFVTLHLRHWRSERNFAETFCAEAQLSGKTRQFLTVSGTPIGFSGGRFRLADPRLGDGPKRSRLVAKVWVDGGILGSLPDSGRKVWVRGPFRCRIAPRNPGRIADGLLPYAPVQVIANGSRFRAGLLPEPAGLVIRARAAFLTWLRGRLAGAPGLAGLELVLWTGDPAGLPAEIQTFYRDGGLLHFLAVSGLRVFGLLLVANLVVSGLLELGLLLRSSLLREGALRLRRGLPLGCCLLLGVTSLGAAPVLRMGMVALCWWGLQRRALDASAFQRLASSGALLLALDPGLLAEKGFLWSVVATGLLCHMVAEGRVAHFAEYVFAMAFLPLLVFPLSAFFSAEVPWAAPLHSLLVGWLWELVLIPVGFSLPAVLLVFPAHGAALVVRWLESGWSWVVKAHLSYGGLVDKARPIVVVRPTWIETAVIEILLLLVVLELRRAWVRRGASSY